MSNNRLEELSVVCNVMGFRLVALREDYYVVFSQETNEIFTFGCEDFICDALIEELNTMKGLVKALPVDAKRKVKGERSAENFAEVNF